MSKMENALSQGNMRTSSNTENNHSELCPICGLQSICDGLGMIRYAVPLDDPHFGKMFRCPNNPPEQDSAWQHRLREISNLSSFADKTFANFLTSMSMYSATEQSSLEYALSASRSFANAPEGWLLLEGTYGCGKTHLAAAIGNACLERGATVLFITVPDLLDHLRAAYGPLSETAYDETFDRVRNAEILILDDLGTENATPWAQEKLFQLFNYRYAERMPTVITTNADIDRIEPRIRSRMLDVSLMTRVKISAPDYRNLMQNERAQIRSNLAHYEHMTFQSFEFKEQTLPDERKNLEAVLRRAFKYAEKPEGWIVFAGDYGTGKTHLAAAIAQHRQEKQEEVMFITVPDLLDYLRTTYNPGTSISFDQRFNDVRNVSMLILDDLGTENATPWAKEKLFQILDYRYITRKPTVITTAREPDELDARIRTRLMDDRICLRLAITATGYATRRKRNTSS